jgi:hypothetical protein
MTLHVIHPPGELKNPLWRVVEEEPQRRPEVLWWSRAGTTSGQVAEWGRKKATEVEEETHTN